MRKYDSFAPTRSLCYVKHFIDGEDFFASLHDELLMAQREVFITDWWLSPYLFLKRPVSLLQEEEFIDSRLDQILKRIVSVF